MSEKLLYKAFENKIKLYKGKKTALFFKKCMFFYKNRKKNCKI